MLTRHNNKLSAYLLFVTYSWKNGCLVPVSKIQGKGWLGGSIAKDDVLPHVCPLWGVQSSSRGCLVITTSQGLDLELYPYGRSGACARATKDLDQSRCSA